MKSLLEIYAIEEDDSVDDFNKQLSKGYTSLKGNGGSTDSPRVGADGASQRAQTDLDQSKSIFDESRLRAKRSLIELFASLSEEDDKPKSKTAHEIDDVDFDFGDDDEEEKKGDAGSWLDVDDDDLSGFGDSGPKSQNDDSDSEDDGEDDDEDELGPDLDYDDPTPDDGGDSDDDSGSNDDDEPEEKNTFASKSAPPSKALQGGKGGLSVKADKATLSALSKAFSLIDTRDDDMNDWIDDCLREISKSISSGSDTLTLPKFEATPGLGDFNEYSGNSKDED